MQIQQDYPLDKANTLGLPCRARYYIEAGSEAELEQAAAFASEQGLRLFVLGEGSNIVLPAYLDAVVLHLVNQSLDISPLGDGHARVRVGAGVNWHSLVQQMLQAGWHGLENLALIPGTVGAAPVQNIGAYGVELETLFASLRAYDTEQRCWLSLDKAACQFAYRDSLFKGAGRQRYVIYQVELQLSAQQLPNTRYQGLASELAERGGSANNHTDVFDAVVAVRQRKLPDPAQIANAGSFFKNPLVSQAEFEALAQRFPGLVSYPQAEGRVKLAAGWLIEQAGLKGHTEGAVGMHGAQALVLVNHGGADAASVAAFASQVQAAVRQQFGVELEQEPLQVQGDGHW